MTPLERVLTTLSHREPDRVPFFLLMTLHGARELGLSIRDYFSKPENVVEGQLRMRQRYGHDCLYPLYYASLEVEAWGGESVFFDDGPPNAGQPFIERREQIRTLEPPEIRPDGPLGRPLAAIAALAEKEGGRVPIIGVVISPFSLPVMQMGFEAYIELLYEDEALLDRLLRVNEAFCVAWANAQLDAGATAICYFDPLASPTMTPVDLFQRTGFEVSRRVMAAIKGPTATHLASGRALGVIDLLADTGTAIVGASALDDLAVLKASCAGRLTVLGNLNGVEMRSWTPDEAEQKVREAVEMGAPGGGFILADNHGEIPWQVPEEVLSTISETVRRTGRSRDTNQ